MNTNLNFNKTWLFSALCTFWATRIVNQYMKLSKMSSYLM